MAQSKGSPAVLFIVLALAGCMGGGGSMLDEDDPQAPRNGASGGDGTLRILVTDDQLSPIEGAMVGLREVQDVKETDAAGAVVFEGLPAGRYTVDVQKLGFRSEARTAQVGSGQAVLEIVLANLVVADAPFSKVDILEGQITCGTGTYVLTQVACGAADSQQRFLHKYEIEAEITGVLFELVWTPSQILSRDLAFFIERDGCGATCPGSSTFARVDGCCYLRVALDEASLDITDVKAGSEGATIQSRTFPAFSSSDNLPTVYTNQRFTIYVEHFWGPLPADFHEDRRNAPDA